MASSITSTTSPTETNRVVRSKSRDILVNLALFILSITFTLVLCEIALRFMGYSPMYVSPERSLFWKYDSLLGWAHQPGQEGIFETAQFRTSVRINQKGLRDPERSYERPDNANRILVAGDSFVWGYGVEESERYSQLLESSLNTEVINAGVSGYSTDQELLWFQNEGIKYDVDLVVLGFTGNDIGDNERGLVSTIYYKPYFVQEGEQLVLSDSPVQQISPQGELIYSVSQKSALAWFLVERYFDVKALYANFKAGRNTTNTAPSTSSTPTNSSGEGESFGLSVALLHKMANLAESKGAKFMIVANDSWWNNPTAETYQAFIDTLRTEGFLVLDVPSTPGFEPETMVISNDGHWNKAGHAFVADQIRNFIESHQLLDTPQ